MQASPFPENEYQTIEIKFSERWQVYHRLQELGITCACETNLPLQIKITSPLAMFQVWNVMRRQTAPRLELIEWLQTCWQTHLSIAEKL